MSFEPEEIFTATELARNCSTLLEKVAKSKGERKIVIMKNNKFQAVLLSLEEYQRLKNALSLLEKIYTINSEN